MLIAILSVVSFAILWRSYFYGSYISPDSTNYLRAAREILEGNGFFVYPEWFANWPIGYPALIAVTAFVTRAEIYLASKILSMIVVWMIGILLYKRFGRTAWCYALVMLNTGFLTIFYYTWSEVPFILGLVIFTFCVSDVITKNTVAAMQYVKLTAAALLLFLSRYIGAFSIMIIGMLWLYNCILSLRYKDKTAKKRLAYLTISGAVSGIFMLSYLLLNKKMAGFMTGVDRIPVTKHRDLVRNLYNAQIIEMNNVFSSFLEINNNPLTLTLWFCFAVFVVYAISRNLGAIKAREESSITPVIFILTGGLYWCSIVVSHFFDQFDGFGYRLLFPSSFLLFIGFAGLLSRNPKINTFIIKFSGLPVSVNVKTLKIQERILTSAVISALFLLTLSGLVLIPRLSLTSRSGYQSMKESVLITNSGIPEHSIVIWGDYRLLYLRDDVKTPHPVDAVDGDLDSFLKRYENNNEVYIYIPGVQERMGTDLANNKTFVQLFGPYKDSGELFVRVR